ncbi:SHOCT domain-containing protein [Bacillaceae bacterium S4-13-56]
MGYGMMGHMFDYGYNYGSGPNWWWIIGSNLVNLLLIAGIIFFIYKLVKGNRGQGKSSDQAIEILKKRYASGEIDEEEYSRKIKILTSSK